MNLSVEQGEFVSLLGPSGCGKTTTLQMIAGFERGEQRPHHARRPRHHARQGQHARPGHRVPELRAVPAHDGGRERELRPGDAQACRKPSAQRARRRRCSRWCTSMRTPQRYPRELSGGQRQRVALARALVIEPPVLLLDEPLSNLDAKLREEMQFELRRIQRKVGTTTIMVTHDQAEALSISDRVVVMEAGARDAGRRAAPRCTSTRARASSPPSSARPTCCEARVARGRRARSASSSAACGSTSRSTPGDFADGAAALFSLRPEKLLLRRCGQGRARRRGAGALLPRQPVALPPVDTPLGELDGAAARTTAASRWPRAGRRALDWPDHCARLLPAERRGAGGVGMRPIGGQRRRHARIRARGCCAGAPAPAAVRRAAAAAAGC